MKLAWSVSVYCRHEGAVLLVLHHRLRAWVPVGGKLNSGETPVETAKRVAREKAGYDQVLLPSIHKVFGAPPGLLLYEEHLVAEKEKHLNFAFIAEVPNKNVHLHESYNGVLWVSSMGDLPDLVPPNVLDGLPYALTAR